MKTIIKKILNFFKVFFLHKVEISDIEVDTKHYWNNKWPKAPGFYYARNKNLYDVRRFIFSDDRILKSIITRHRLKGKNNDETAWKCMRFIQKYITYKSDKGEDWSYPVDTYYKKTGDCEDGTNLMISLMINAGIASWKIKNCCGFVYNPKTKKHDIGHSYPIYLASDNEWRVLDWCYIPKKDHVLDRIYAKKVTFYGKIWWTFNDIYCWAQHKFTINRKVK